MKGIINMDLWHKFKLAELDQLMRQDDDIFVYLLNKIREGETDQNVEHIIKSHDSFTKTIHIIRVIFCIFLQKTPQLPVAITIN